MYIRNVDCDALFQVVSMRVPWVNSLSTDTVLYLLNPTVSDKDDVYWQIIQLS